jgi:hypothetical protein
MGSGITHPTLKDDKIETELKELFKVLADGAEREEEMRAENAPKTAIDDIWLPGRNPLRNVLSFSEAPELVNLGVLC